MDVEKSTQLTYTPTAPVKRIVKTGAHLHHWYRFAVQCTMYIPIKKVVIITIIQNSWLQTDFPTVNHLNIPNFFFKAMGHKFYDTVFWINKSFKITSIQCKNGRVGNSLNGFLSDLLVFCEPKSELAIRSWKRANHSRRSFFMNDLSESLPSLFCLERPEWIARGRSFVKRTGVIHSWAWKGGKRANEWKSKFPTLKNGAKPKIKWPLQRI